MEREKEQRLIRISRLRRRKGRQWPQIRQRMMSRCWQRGSGSGNGGGWLVVVGDGGKAAAESSSAGRGEATAVVGSTKDVGS
ncbi:hypothetical protein QJS04_geneDACA002095 [Acorus gramineus]|uniref:Uncharacterized protein n=1 Tax=Acorus gramineus TaxID=55184 RepID=A0AAV9A7E9_ACOGR|nr:hypothetical protein QJS04_geneDACA002095 [Acorus gramineus]